MKHYLLFTSNKIHSFMVNLYPNSHSCSCIYIKLTNEFSKFRSSHISLTFSLDCLYHLRPFKLNFFFYSLHRILFYYLFIYALSRPPTHLPTSLQAPHYCLCPRFFFFHPLLRKTPLVNNRLFFSEQLIHWEL